MEVGHSPFKMESGSASAKNSIKSYLDQGAAVSVTICGHSLGGALATLLALDVGVNTFCRAPSAYTYASPRTGDHAFSNFHNTAIPATYRVGNRQDLVPKLPPILPLPYKHVNTLWELNPPPGQIAPTIPCMHHLTTYLCLMSQPCPSPKCYLWRMPLKSATFKKMKLRPREPGD